MNRASHSHNFSETLARAGFKVTAPRLSILQALARAKAPLSADDLFEKLAGSIDRVTLYRNLKGLVGKGVLYQTDFRTGKSLFELQDACDEHPHHHHVVCTRCGTVAHVDACLPQSIGAKALANSAFAVIENHVLEFFGVCAKCMKAGGKSPLSTYGR